ncbi:hypothetical protein C8T65DRAFT_700707 [Cerioporus squamosus]|nr:hypothetical protein C8T65DRAFT_700707 [Cerioporus squamosus]
MCTSIKLKVKKGAAETTGTGDGESDADANEDNVDELSQKPDQDVSEETTPVRHVDELLEKLEEKIHEAKTTLRRFKNEVGVMQENVNGMESTLKDLRSALQEKGKDGSGVTSEELPQTKDHPAKSRDGHPPHRACIRLDTYYGSRGERKGHIQAREHCSGCGRRRRYMSVGFVQANHHHLTMPPREKTTSNEREDEQKKTAPEAAHVQQARPGKGWAEEGGTAPGGLSAERRRREKPNACMTTSSHHLFKTLKQTPHMSTTYKRFKRSSKLGVSEQSSLKGTGSARPISNEETVTHTEGGEEPEIPSKCWHRNEPELPVAGLSAREADTREHDVPARGCKAARKNEGTE